VTKKIVIFIILTSALGGILTDCSSTSASQGVTIDAKVSPVVWLCKPGLLNNPCLLGESVTEVNPNLTTDKINIANPTGPKKVDCFYVYPTISGESTGNANLEIQASEIGIAKDQASYFSSVCNVYAPMYRQLTLSALIGKSTTKPNPALAYADVKNAWLYYLKYYNQGKGVILIGHSQGAIMLIQLISNVIDDNASMRKLLVGAYLLGGNATVPIGKTIGGSFKHIAICTSKNEVGCVVAYSSFNTTPPPVTFFGRVFSNNNEEVICVNAASLLNNKSSDVASVVHPLFLSTANLLQATVPQPVVNTPWVSYPNLFSAQCQYQQGASYLLITDIRHPGDERPQLWDALGGSWGLHLMDVNIDYGDLVKLAALQAKNWLKLNG
jgi:hypothetical protein